MKAIVSHDIDHFTVWEHKKDLIIPKFLLRSLLELSARDITFSEFYMRSKRLIENRMHNLEELLLFNKEQRIPATFFVGVANGKGLSYSIKHAEIWIKRILSEGFDVGVHGIAFQESDNMQKEYSIFQKISGLGRFGIRMHYLQRNENTLTYLSHVGYMFDTSVYELKAPYKIHDMWVFPLHIMDVYVLNKQGSFSKTDLERCKDATKRVIDDIFARKLQYINLLFHDVYFNAGFKKYQAWYVWLIEYLKSSEITFTNYENAVSELDFYQSKFDA